MRIPLPDEIVPVELTQGNNPRINFIGRAEMTFPPRDGDGRRIEWTTPEHATQLTSEPYNRAGQPPLFTIAHDLKPQNLNIDQHVIESIRKQASTVAAILAPFLVSTPTVQGAPKVSWEPEVVPSDAIPLEDMSKEQLLGFARESEIVVDARWNQAKILDTVQRELV